MFIDAIIFAYSISGVKHEVHIEKVYLHFFFFKCLLSLRFTIGSVFINIKKSHLKTFNINSRIRLTNFVTKIIDIKMKYKFDE